MTHEFTHLDLFSGVGGFSLGFEREGFRTIGFAEIDPFAGAVLKKHWPDVPNYGDVRNVSGLSATVITGGFPCQPYSLAGKRDGASDDRDQWPAMRDALKRNEWDYFIGENVYGLVNLGLDQILADLESDGYAAQPLVIPAHAVGLPQIEGSRVFIMAASNGERCNQGDKIPQGACASCRPPEGEQNGGGIGSFRGNSGRVWQAPVTAFDRVDYGLPGELDRIRCLGNAVAPALAQAIAQAIKETIARAIAMNL